jgi:UDP-N-acetylmuramoyl-tripeptide--D-alanyl-D-alanine ligase
VLNVGTAHLSEFGTREQVALAKGEIVAALTDEGTAVLNADDPLVGAMADRTSAATLTFGVSGDVRWHGVRTDELGRATFDIAHDGACHSVTLTQSGAHQVANAAAAAAMALAAGLDLIDVAERLGSARHASRWRMELHERSDGVVVLNDAYNANPASMIAAIDTLSDIAGRRSGRGVAVLGEMLELGHEAAHAHRDVGVYAAAAGVDVLVTVGEQAALIARGATGSPGWAGLTVETAGRDQALAWVRQNVAPGDVVLVKASRGAALEHVAEQLLSDEGGEPSR